MQKISDWTQVAELQTWSNWSPKPFSKRRTYYLEIQITYQIKNGQECCKELIESKKIVGSKEGKFTPVDEQLRPICWWIHKYVFVNLQ